MVGKVIGRTCSCRRAALRRTLRGYRKLRQAGTIGVINETCSAFLWNPLQIAQGKFSPYFFGSALDRAEFIARQYLYVRSILYRFHPQLFSHFAGGDVSIVYPLPLQWQKTLAGRGLRVARLRCTLLWVWFVALYWAYGIYTILTILSQVAGEWMKPRFPRATPFVHFDNLTGQNLPHETSQGPTHDIMSWYLQWCGRKDSLTFLTYRGQAATRPISAPVPVLHVKMPFLPSWNSWQVFSFGAWCAGAAAFSLLDCLRGRWWHALLLAEAAHARAVGICRPEQLAHDYMLHLSGWAYRPLWTYEAEHCGARIAFYHYSTNSEGFKRPEGYPPDHYSWKVSTWPLHLVWDEYHADFVRRAVQHPGRVEIVGPIWFASGPHAIPKTEGEAAAVFDVQPVRSSRYKMLAFDFDYYTAANAVAFLDDVAAACEEAGLLMMWKRKREIGAHAHPRYRRAALKLDEKSHVRFVNPEFSAFRLVEACDVVISMPFTSTALIGRHLNKPSCYYDPSGQLVPDDRGAHGIPIIQSYDELVRWIGSHASSALHPRPTTNMDNAS